MIKNKVFYDASGTKRMLFQTNEFEEDVTANMAAMSSAEAAKKTAIEAKRQNDLYEKEIKEIHRNGTITMVAAVIGAFAAIIAALDEIRLIISVLLIN